jgi:uncharacterized protein with FMN-binding domain
MKKALPAIAVSAAGLTWLLHAQGLIDASAPSKSTNAATSLSTNRGTPGATTTTSASPTTTQAGTTGPTSATASRTSDGPTIDTRYGPVQVEAVLQGSKLIDVKVLQYPTDRRKSQEINDQALPLLHDQAVSAQGAQIDGVSGATYTSSGYAQSLQAGLDQAK